MMGRNLLIYALLEPLTEEVRYIDQTTYGLKYLKKYFHPGFQKQRRYVASWIKSLAVQNLKPIVMILEENILNKEILNEREKYYISYYKTLGHKLTNLAEGGNSNSGFKMTESAIEELKKRDRTALFEGRDNFFKNNPHPKWHNNPRAEEYKDILRKMASIGGQAAAIKKRKKIRDQFGNIYGSQKEAAKKLGISASEITNYFKGGCRAVKGYTFTRV